MKNSLSDTLQTTVLFLVVAGILALALSGSLGFISNGVNAFLVSAQTWVSSRFVAIQDFLTAPRDVAALRQRNAELEAEVARLQAQIVQLRSQASEMQALAALVNFSRANPENVYTAATVIGRDPSPFLHYLIIDKGSNDGLRRGMPVVTEQGLVGRIDAVIGSAARVQLITDPTSAVNARLERADREAVLTGAITGDLTLEMLPQDAALEIGDVVLTSGLGGSYPPDLIIGQVVSIRRRDSDLFQQAFVQPAVDLTQLKLVLVITDFRPVNIAPLLP
ncbi:MAG: rod shape-determining protein MreC [Anaerolineales bacterium]|nr:rod shape-determining protein MreC [Anaerolineales bacterium]MCX7753612.1 rod shape-determining protein MreC [Anaerolineales bacterium]MDW8278189.1 rod shape-determining protein MreC [Anaerolineales bacterium]